MYRFGWRACLLVLLFVPGSASTQSPPAEVPAATCASVESCIAALKAQARSHRQVSEAVRARLATFGDSAVDALVPLLLDNDLWVRESAGLALTEFRRIEPRHLPALLHAWRKGDTINNQGQGNGWLPRPIAATGSEEALRLLWQNFLRDPMMMSNAQVFFALAMFPDQIRPLVLERFKTCKGDKSGEACEGLYELLAELEPRFPPWSVEAIVDLAANARSDGVREGAELQLVELKHPAGLAPIQRRLASASPESALGDDGRWEARTLIRAVAGYGGAARSSGPKIARYLESRFDEDLRTEAALALGRVEDSTAVPVLLALEPQLSDDWLLAYNVAESLGRIGAAEAKPLLSRLAANHWHSGVRNNAARALNALVGGSFARPGIESDPQPYSIPRGEDGTEYLYMGELRFAGDDAGRSCSLSDGERPQTLESDPVGLVRWPGRDIQQLEYSGVPGSDSRQVRRRIPVATVQGEVSAILPVRSGQLVAFAAGEFGGGLYFLPTGGSARKLIDDNVAFAWQMGGRLYVAGGLSHLFMDRGHIYVVDPIRMKVERSIRLPASPRRLSASSRHAVIVGTASGELAIGEDGALIQPETLDYCDRKSG